jgi:hypothetical protein
MYLFIYVWMYVNFACEMMCYISKYTASEECNISCVKRYSVLNECFMMLVVCSVASGRWCAEHMGHGQAQIKDLFCQCFVHLLRIPEIVILECNSFQANSDINLCCSLLMEPWC